MSYSQDFHEKVSQLDKLVVFIESEASKNEQFSSQLEARRVVLDKKQTDIDQKEAKLTTDRAVIEQERLYNRQRAEELNRRETEIQAKQKKIDESQEVLTGLLAKEKEVDAKQALLKIDLAKLQASIDLNTKQLEQLGKEKAVERDRKEMLDALERQLTIEKERLIKISQGLGTSTMV